MRWLGNRGFASRFGAVAAGGALALALGAARPAPPPPPGPSGPLSAAEQAAAFRAAGFRKVGSQWKACGDPGRPGYEPGVIESVADRNGDGLPEAVITEGSNYCYGNVATGFALVSRQPGGGWKLIFSSPGVPTFLPSHGVGNWPDISIGGPYFCFPVRRWDGTTWVPHGFQYAGKPCTK